MYLFAAIIFLYRPDYRKEYFGNEKEISVQKSSPFLALEDVFSSGKLPEMKVYVIDDIGKIKNGVLSLATKIPLFSTEEPIVNVKPTFRCNFVSPYHLLCTSLTCKFPSAF